MIYRIPRSDIVMSDPMPFNQHWEARVSVPIDEIGDVGLALHSAYAAFRVGDKVNICAFATRDWQEMTEVAEFRIHSLANSRVRTMRVGATAKVPKEVSPKVGAPGAPLTVKPADNVFNVCDGDHVVEVFVERKQAEAFARQNSPSGKPAKAAA
jgi:hypothetical protein